MKCGVNGGVQSGVAGTAWRRRLGYGVAFLAIMTGLPGLTAVPAMAQAQQTSIGFAVPSGPLGSALTAFADQSGLQILYASDTVSRRTATGLSGTYTVDQALSLLLEGTSLTFRFAGSNTVVVEDPAGPAMSYDGSIVLGEVNVTAWVENAASGSGFQGTPDWVYATPGATSVVSREAIESAGGRNARDLLDDVAGVMVNNAEGQNPGLQVNIRGLQDQSRVVTMIDGARQDFQRGGHGGSQQVYVDSSFIRSVEVERSTGNGVGGAGSLGGAVNFRSLTAEDIIAEGRVWGLEVTGRTGDNAFTFDGNAVGGLRLSENFSILGGISHKQLGNYTPGTNGKLILPSSSYVDGEVLSSGYESAGTFLKMEGSPTADLSFDLSWIHYDIDSDITTNSLGTVQKHEQRYLSDTVSSSLSWDPESELIDLTARLWATRTLNEEIRGYATPDPVDYSMTSFGGSLENTSRFELPVGTMSLNYGVEAYTDRGETDAIARIDEDGVDWSYGYRGMNPSGRYSMVSGFVNSTIEHSDWLTVTGGLRYDHYNLSGTPQITGVAEAVLVTPRTCLEYHPFIPTICLRWQNAVYEISPTPNQQLDIDISSGALLPSATIAVQPTDWLQPFVSYSQSQRPPTIMETLFSGGHPNVAPVDNMPNPNLRPEHGQTWEIGANITADGLLTPDDAFRFKSVYFHREIEDYISLGRGYYAPFDRYYDTYVNLDGTTTMRGVELEGSYDMGVAYAGLSYTWIDTDLAKTYTFNGPAGDPQGTLPGDAEARPAVIFVAPEQRFTVDAGLRLLEEKLTIGGRLTYVDEAQPEVGQLAASYRAEDYTVIDLYGSYKFSDNATLSVAIDNVTDRAYWPALGTNALPAAGRTATVSLNVRF